MHTKSTVDAPKDFFIDKDFGVVMKHLQMKKLNVKNSPTEWSMDSSVKECLSKNPTLKLLEGGGGGKRNRPGNYNGSDQIFIKNNPTSSFVMIIRK